MDIITKTNIKDNIMKCIHLCGGLTGKFAKILCEENHVFQEMMEDGKIRRVPIEVKMSDKTTKKMYLYELNSKQKTASFPSMKEEDAKYISILNNCYCKYQNAQWLETADIKRLAQASGINNAKLVPSLMFYSDDQLIAVYVHKSYSKLTDAEKMMVSENLSVDKVLEYLC